MVNKFLLGEKIGMTQYLTEEGNVLPVTILRVGPCQILKLEEGLTGVGARVLFGYGVLLDKKCNRPKAGFFKALGVSPKKRIRQISIKTAEGLEVSKEITADVFSLNEKVNIRGKSIGKGFAGTIKRHNFARGPRSHGSKNYRAPGSIGAGTTPGRVLKGKRMGGHMGDAVVTVKNLTIVKIDSAENFIYVKGAVPGKINAALEIFN